MRKKTEEGTGELPPRLEGWACAAAGSPELFGTRGGVVREGGGEAGSISFLLCRNPSSKYLASIGIDRAEMWASKEFEVNKK